MTSLKKKEYVALLPTMSVLGFILSLIFAYLTKKLIIAKFKTVL